MGDIIRVKIDVKKIDKARLYVGAKGTYLDATLLPNRDGTDQYGNDYMVVQDVSKEEREAGVKGAILGNAKIIHRAPGNAAREQSAPREPIPGTHAPEPPADDGDSGLPF